MPMNLVVNGESRLLDTAPDPTCLNDVVRALGHNPTLVVVEHNGAIVPKSQWENTSIGDGDNLEIVTIVGGGS